MSLYYTNINNCINTKDGRSSQVEYTLNLPLKYANFCNLNTFGSTPAPHYISSALTISNGQQCVMYQDVPSIGNPSQTVSKLYFIGTVGTTNLSLDCNIVGVEFDAAGFHNVSVSVGHLSGLTNLNVGTVLVTNNWTAGFTGKRELQLTVSAAGNSAGNITNNVYLGDWSIVGGGRNSVGN